MEKLKVTFSNYVKDLQHSIIEALKKEDEDLVVKQDQWQRKNTDGSCGGGGLTCALTGSVIENAGVNTSLVYGPMHKSLALKFSERGEVGHLDENSPFWATGISLIIHPRNPRIPTVHANFRLMIIGQKAWFGGGADLTPFYPHEEDFKSFHMVWKNACDKAQASYAQMKKTCDEYFVNKHRNNEMRGIGGIFFDHHNSGDQQKDFEMVKILGDHFIESYLPILKKRKWEAYEADDVIFQLHRRGRYVEFNLLHDRGTLFGLQTGGRTESILISLPGRCQFSYDYKPAKSSIHERMMEYYFPKDWATWK